MATLSEILKREFIINGKSKTSAAATLNVSERTIENYMNGNRHPKPDALAKLAKFLGFSLSELSDEVQNVPPATLAEDSGELDTVKNAPATSYLKKRQKIKNGAKKYQVPFYDAEAVAGLVETEMTPIHAPAGTIDIGDLLHDSKAAIRIYGNSMLPSYPPGCVLGLAPAEGSFIEPGEVYVIETAYRRIFKRLFYKDDNPSSELITCYSDNIMKFEGGARHGLLAYPPFELPKEEIKRLFVVTGVIKRNANSVIMNR